MLTCANCTILSVDLHLKVLFLVRNGAFFVFDIVTVFCVTTELNSEVNGN